MKIEVHNRMTVEGITPSVPYAVISMTDINRPWAKVAQNEYCRGVIQLHVDDADVAGIFNPAHLSPDQAAHEQQSRPLNIFGDDQAHLLINGVLDWQKAGVQLLICQCDAGKSRSAGTAAAFGKILNGDDTFIFDNPQYIPNRKIYRTILEVFYLEYND